LAQRLAILTKSFCGFPQSLPANAGIVSQIMPQPLPSKSFSIHSLSYRSMQYSLSYWHR
jgi:hypothetical protein